jgi:Uma2 family endonuclease
MPAVETRKITGKDLWNMEVPGPHELVEGELIAMSPTGLDHGYYELKLGRYLSEFLESGKLGWAFSGEVGIFTKRNPDTVRAADLACYSRRRFAVRPSGGFQEAAPDMIAEIISPSDRWSGVHTKIEEYFAIGVEQVWIVDPRTLTIRIYTSPERYASFGSGDTVHGSGILEGFTLEIDGLFD